MGDDISSSLSSMAICFDFCSTNVVKLSNWNPYFYRFWCHLPLITQLSFNLIRYQYPKKLLSTFTFLFTLTIEFEWHNNCCCGQYNNSTLDLGWTVKLAKFTSKNTALFYNGDSAVSLLSCIIHVQCGTRRYQKALKIIGLNYQYEKETF